MLNKYSQSKYWEPAKWNAVYLQDTKETSPSFEKPAPEQASGLDFKLFVNAVEYPLVQQFHDASLTEQDTFKMCTCLWPNK